MPAAAFEALISHPFPGAKPVLPIFAAAS